jgi:flavin reductase (DIM6/NTAB) family NADH-FMN oxidoreductase RutF
LRTGRIPCVIAGCAANITLREVASSSGPRVHSPAMHIDPAVATHAELHRFIIGVVIPRPIAWVSTIGQDGHHNLAPFSFFNAIASQPPLLVISINDRPDGPKDTLRHIRETKDFVINLVDEPLMDRMVETSGEWAPEVDEFALTKLTAARSERVKSPRLVEAPVSMECVLDRILDYETTSLVIGRMVWAHFRDDLLTDGRIDPLKLRPVARLGGDGYTVVREVIRRQRPKAPKPDAARDG